MSHVVKIEIWMYSHAMYSHAIALWSLLYVNQNSKNFALRLRKNPLQFSGLSIYNSL